MRSLKKMGGINFVYEKIERKVVTRMNYHFFL